MDGIRHPLAVRGKGLWRQKDVMNDLTKQQFDKLMDCELRDASMGWRKGWKFVRRGRQWCKVANITMGGTIFVTNKSVFDVRIGEKQLEYDRYITNPKKPFAQ